MIDYSRSIAAVRARIAEVCRRAGRDPAEVHLVAVTKYLPVEELDDLAAHGIADIGEHRVLEALERRRRTHAEYRWHMIGHVQTNKVKKLLDWADVLHSVDRIELAAALERELSTRGKRLPAYVQINVSGEASKGGFRRGDAVQEVRAAAPHLDILGLMTMAPEGGDARPHFRRLREMAERAGVRGLSMGMSHDFEIAIEEGATCVRVGTALFSPQ